MKIWVFIFLIFISTMSNADKLNQGYLLGPGDKIEISVYRELDLKFSGQISQQGTIDFPLLGSVTISDFTQKEAKEYLQNLLLDGYLVSPSVSIRVSSYRPFFIYGEVRNPGSYSYQPDITLEQAIALSGGLKDRASRKKWMIQRGKDKENILAHGNTIILPGDVIKIDKSFF